LARQIRRRCSQRNQYVISRRKHGSKESLGSTYAKVKPLLGKIFANACRKSCLPAKETCHRTCRQRHEAEAKWFNERTALRNEIKNASKVPQGGNFIFCPSELRKPKGEATLSHVH
jgi:hypothetical protein